MILFGTQPAHEQNKSTGPAHGETVQQVELKPFFRKIPQITIKMTEMGAMIAHLFASLPSRTNLASRINLATRRSRHSSDFPLPKVATSKYQGRTDTKSATFKGALRKLY